MKIHAKEIGPGDGQFFDGLLTLWSSLEMKCSNSSLPSLDEA